MNLYNSFILLIVLGFERGATQTLDCAVPDVIKLGEPLEISCIVSGTVQFYNLATLAKDNINIVTISRFEEGVSATIDSNYVSRVTAVVNVISSTVRKLTVRYSTIQCSDNGPYEWTFQIVGSSASTLSKSITMAVKVIPQFGSNYGNNITYSPATNLVEGDTVTFTCQGDVGNTPVGQLSWFYYLNGSTTAMDVSTKSTTQSPQDSIVAGRTCSKTRVSTLTLTLTKEMHWFVVRCTVNQDQPFTALGQGYKMTQQIDVMYKPTISSIRKVPGAVQYTDGDALLTLTCTATSNPAPEYDWTYESVYTNRTQIGTGNQLVLRNLNLNSAGVYTCVAYNLIKGVNQTTNASTHITVVERTTQAPTTTSTSQNLERTTLTPTTERPISTSQVYNPLSISITRDPNLDVYVEGLEILTLTCVANSNPPPLYTWIFQSGYDHQELMGHENKLILRRLTAQHSGIYTCMSYNTMNDNNQTVYSSFLVEHMPITIQTKAMMSQTKSVDAVVIGTTFSVTVAVMTLTFAFVLVALGRRYRCVKKQGGETHPNIEGSSGSVECAEYQTAPYNSIPRTYETLDRTAGTSEMYSELDNAKVSRMKNIYGRQH